MSPLKVGQAEDGGASDELGRVARSIPVPEVAIQFWEASWHQKYKQGKCSNMVLTVFILAIQVLKRTWFCWKEVCLMEKSSSKWQKALSQTNGHTILMTVGVSFKNALLAVHLEGAIVPWKSTGKSLWRNFDRCSAYAFQKENR